MITVEGFFSEKEPADRTELARGVVDVDDRRYQFRIHTSEHPPGAETHVSLPMVLEGAELRRQVSNYILMAYQLQEDLKKEPAPCVSRAN